MSCCGAARRTATGLPHPRDERFAAAGAPIFEYIGATSLRVVGGETGREYRFDHPGARRAVDPRDQPSLAQVPKLRRVFAQR